MLRQLYKSSVKRGFSSDDSKNPSSRNYDFNETLLNFLVEKLRADSKPSTNEDEVRENIADLILDEDFPDDLILKGDHISKDRASWNSSVEYPLGSVKLRRQFLTY